MQTGFSVYIFHVYTMSTCQTRDNGFLSAFALCCDCPASGNLKQFGKYQINIKKY